MLQRPSGPAVAALAAAFMILAGPGWARAQAGGPPTVEEARAFVEAAEERLLDLSTKAGRAAWVQANFITDDTERIASDLNKDLIAASMELAKAATRFDGMTLPPELARKMKLIKLAPIPLPAPSDSKLQTELAQTAAGLEATYGMALDKIAFLPFGLLIDQWRWKVFSGEVPPAGYNKAWLELRRKYQGVAPLEARGEEWFDPGAKYHVPANVPYTRYFLARILQFQFHRALCREAGYTGPLHQCSIYGSKAAGAKLNSMLEMGQSRPWPEALEAMTGEKQIDATAILDYFKPLMVWLEKENKGRKMGWR